MRRKSLLLLMLIAVLTILLTPKQTFSPLTTIVGTKPLPSTAALGTNFVVNITVANVVDLYGWEINMTFNPTVLNVVDMVEGPFLLDFADSLGIYTWPLGPLIDNNVGWVQMSNSLFDPSGPPADGADGSGVLATITFHVLAEGTVPLHFNKTLLNTNVGGLPSPITHTAKDGFFQLPLGDIDNDGDVDGVDFGIFAPCYGSSLGQAAYKVAADLDRDDDVDGVDFGIFAPNYGKS